MTIAALPYDSNNLRKWEFENRLYQRALARYLDRMSAALVRSGARHVLDAGCGEGYVHRGLRARGYAGAWHGVDLSAAAVELAARRFPGVSWEVGDLRALRFASGSHELVLSSQVLEHIPDPERVRDELARVAARWLLISVPLEPVFRSLCALTVAAGIGQDPGHVNFWTPRSFRRFLEPVGRLEHWEWTSAYQIALVRVRH